MNAVCRARRRSRRFLAGALPALLLVTVGISWPDAALADVVVLAGGQEVEGEVTVDEGSGTVTVAKPSGVVVKFRREEVREIVRRPGPGVEFRRRLAAMRAGDLDGLLRLARWAEEKKLRAELQLVSRRILRIDPNQPFARRSLGYVVFDNAWVLESELRKKRKEQGLVKFRGEWMKAEERDRRRREEARRKIEDLLRSLQAENRYVQEFAVRELMAYRSPGARDVFASYLDDPREMVRIVAASALANFAAPADPAEDPVAQRITARLVESIAAEGRSPAEVRALQLALSRFQPAESFSRALARLVESSPRPEVRARLEEVIRRVLRKAWVPRLCRAVTSGEGARARTQPVVREVLVRVLGVDLGFDEEAWLAWWRRNEHRFRDEG